MARQPGFIQSSSGCPYSQKGLGIVYTFNHTWEKIQPQGPNRHMDRLNLASILMNHEAYWYLQISKFKISDSDQN